MASSDGEGTSRAAAAVRRTALLLSALVGTPDRSLDVFRTRRAGNPDVAIDDLRRARDILDVLGSAIEARAGHAAWERVREAWRLLCAGEPENVADQPPPENAPASEPDGGHAGGESGAAAALPPDADSERVAGPAREAAPSQPASVHPGLTPEPVPRPPVVGWTRPAAPPRIIGRPATVGAAAPSPWVHPQGPPSAEPPPVAGAGPALASAKPTLPQAGAPDLRPGMVDPPGHAPGSAPGSSAGGLNFAALNEVKLSQESERTLLTDGARQPPAALPFSASPTGPTAREDALDVGLDPPDAALPLQVFLPFRRRPAGAPKTTATSDAAKDGMVPASLPAEPAEPGAPSGPGADTPTDPHALGPEGSAPRSPPPSAGLHAAQPSELPPHLGALTMEHYAALCAECSVSPQWTAQIHARYGVRDAAEREALDEHWRQQLARDPRLEDTLRWHYARYEQWARSRGG